MALKIATEEFAAGKGGTTPSSYSATRCLTKSRVSEFGCRLIGGSYSDNQLVAEDHLDKDRYITGFIIQNNSKNTVSSDNYAYLDSTSVGWNKFRGEVFNSGFISYYTYNCEPYWVETESNWSISISGSDESDYGLGVNEEGYNYYKNASDRSRVYLNKDFKGDFTNITITATSGGYSKSITIPYGGNDKRTRGFPIGLLVDPLPTNEIDNIEDDWVKEDDSDNHRCLIAVRFRLYLGNDCDFNNIVLYGNDNKQFKFYTKIYGQSQYQLVEFVNWENNDVPYNWKNLGTVPYIPLGTQNPTKSATYITRYFISSYDNNGRLVNPVYSTDTARTSYILLSPQVIWKIDDSYTYNYANNEFKSYEQPRS